MQNNLKNKIFSKISYTKQDYEGILEDFKSMFTGEILLSQVGTTCQRQILSLS